MKIIRDVIPEEYVDRFPASIFYVREKNTTIKVDTLHYAESKLYNTKKMRCYSYYKPVFL